MNNISTISIAEPSIEHYEAFIDTCKKMQTYINDDSIPNDVSKHESKGFIFARDGYANMSKEDFEKIIVNGYKEKAQDGAEKPEYFRFIMDGDTIVGSVNARALKRDRFDEENGLSTFEKWQDARVTGAEVVLPDYRGKGIFGKAQKLFFDEMRELGINEITYTVLSNNDSSQKAHEKMMDKYGGRLYQVYGDSDGTGIKYYNRYVISTDTSGKSKDLYNDNKEDKVNEQLVKVRQKILENKSPSITVLSATKAPYKPKEITINPNSIHLYQSNKEKE
jgi:predicted acetyltransferase